MTIDFNFLKKEAILTYVTFGFDFKKETILTYVTIGFDLITDKSFLLCFWSDVTIYLRTYMYQCQKNVYIVCIVLC